MHKLGNLMVFDDVIVYQNDLERHRKIRDMMGGQLYWGIANDECNEFSNNINRLYDIKTRLDRMSVKDIESFLRIKKLELLDTSLIRNENYNPIHSVLESIELKYIEEFLTEYKKDNLTK